MNGPHHDDVDERLCDWVDGRMTERERERFAAELRVSASLRQQLADYERTVAAIRAALQAPTTPVPMADRVVAALATQQNRAAQPIVAMPWRGRSWSHLGFCAASAAALLLLALWIDSWAGRSVGNPASSTDAAQVDVRLQAKQQAAAAPVDTDGFGAANERSDDSAPGLRKLAEPTVPAPGQAAPANSADPAPGAGAPGEGARGVEPQPKPPSPGGGGADSAPGTDDAKRRERDAGKPVAEGESAATGELDKAGYAKSAPEKPAAEPASPPGAATGGLPGSEGQAGGLSQQPPVAGQPSEAGNPATTATEPVGPRDVVPPPQAGRAPSNPSPSSPSPSTAGADGPRRYGSRGSPSAGTGGGGAGVGAPAADGPWPELTIVGARPPVAELSDRSRVLLGFVVADDEVAKVAAKRAAEPGEGKAKSEPKPAENTWTPAPTALPPAELSGLLATFVRSACVTPANELRWPTNGGGMVLRRLPAERSDATDTVWIAEGAPEELRLLLGQVGAVASGARWQVQPGEFAPELQQHVLATESTVPPQPPSTPTAPVAGAQASEGPSPAPKPPGGREAPASGVVTAEPGPRAPTTGSVVRRRVVLRFRLAP